MTFLARQMASQSIAHIYCSSLGRTQASAKLCAQQLQLACLCDDDLQERNLGLWQGQQRNRLALRHHASFQRLYLNEGKVTAASAKPPTGESISRALMRFEKSLFNIAQQITKNGKPVNVLVLSHGDIISQFVATLNKAKNTNTKNLLLAKPMPLANGDVIKIAFEHLTRRFVAC